MDAKHLTVNLIAESIVISLVSVHSVLIEIFWMSKLYVRWIPRMLTTEHKLKGLRFLGTFWLTSWITLRISTVDLLVKMKPRLTILNLNQRLKTNSGNILVFLSRKVPAGSDRQCDGFFKKKKNLKWTVMGMSRSSKIRWTLFSSSSSSSSSSSYRAGSTDIPDPLSPLLPIVHRPR